MTSIKSLLSLLAKHSRIARLRRPRTNSMQASLLLVLCLRGSAPCLPRSPCGVGLGRPGRMYSVIQSNKEKEKGAGSWPGFSNLKSIQEDARGRRIIELLSLTQTMVASDPERKELNGLMSRGDTYNASVFTAEHRKFKAAHNEIVARLTHYCAANQHPLVFYLDGPDMGTTLTLQEKGLMKTQLFVANIFRGTCAALTDAANLAALAPENVIPGRAEDALARAFASKPFACYYLDGCGGFCEPLLEMIKGIFAPERRQPARFAVGFSLTLAHPLKIPLPDREQEILRTLATTARRHGFIMWHVADEPKRYLGEDAEPPPRMHAGTLTTWVVLENVQARQGTSYSM